MAAGSILGGGNPLGSSLTLFLIQLLLIVTISRLLSIILKKIKQPAVIAEVVTGILLGPSVFGHIPKFTTTIFPKASLDIFNVIAQLGLILFMFVIGLEIDIKLVKNNMGRAFFVSISAIVLPFALGTAASVAVNKAYPSPAGFGNFLLFSGVALSITAFPVLARILSEFKLLDTRVGSVAISCAAVDDVVAWCVLALVVAIVQAGSGLIALYTVLTLVGFILFMFFLVRPCFIALYNYLQKGSNPEGPPSFVFISVILLFMLLASWFTEVIGVHSIFGAFLTGVVVPRGRGLNARILERLEDLIVIIFCPLYFTYSGLRTDLSTLNDGTAWGLAFLIVMAASVGKITAATITSKFLMNMTWRESFAVGILMNTKGLVELIVLNVGLDAGVLTTQVFSIFVLMAIINTISTTPLLWFFYLRHLSPSKATSESELSVAVTVKDPKNAVRMVQLMASLFEQSYVKVNVRALFLQEISDRPSSYFFSEYYSMWSSAPARRSSPKKTLANTVADDDTIPKEFNITSRIFVTSNTGVDVSDYVKDKKMNMVAMALVHPYGGDSPREMGIPLPRSLTELFTTTNMEETLIHDSKSAVAIVIRKSHTVETEPARRILVVYRGQEYESALLEILNSMVGPKERKGERLVKKVTIVTPIAASIGGSNVDSGLEINQIQDEHPLEKAFEESDKGYDLVLIASERRDHQVYHSSIVQHSPITVIIVYNPKTGTLFPSFEVTVQDVASDPTAPRESIDVDELEMRKQKMEKMEDS